MAGPDSKNGSACYARAQTDANSVESCAALAFASCCGVNLAGGKKIGFGPFREMGSSPFRRDAGLAIDQFGKRIAVDAEGSGGAGNTQRERLDALFKDYCARDAADSSWAGNSASSFIKMAGPDSKMAQRCYARAQTDANLVESCAALAFASCCGVNLAGF